MTKPPLKTSEEVRRVLIRLKIKRGKNVEGTELVDGEEMEDSETENKESENDKKNRTDELLTA